MAETYKVIDLFAGAGGLSLGFTQGGFKVVAANDIDSDAAATFELNHPGVSVLRGKIQDLDGETLLAAAGLQRGELDVLVGGPPCQAFSECNRYRGLHDERFGLFREYLRIACFIRPRFVVMENVTGILSIGKGCVVEEIYRSLKQIGYYVEHRTLRAEEYGVPQERRRVFFIGSLNQKRIHWPFPICWPRSLFPCPTVWDAIGDLPPLEITEGEEEAEYTGQPFSDYQRYAREGATKLYNHVAPFLSPINLERLKHIPQGGSWRDIPHELLSDTLKQARRRDRMKRYGRMHSQGRACTILTRCDLHKGAYIHPFQQRCITVREAARLQSFPDRFRFVGARGSQFRQVGNAVPPLLAKAIAEAVAEMLRREGVGEGPAEGEVKCIGAS